MKINNDIALDFDDVLLVPQRSKTASRKDVKLERLFKFYHSPRTWTGIPIMVANMDTCGTFDMGKVLAEYKVITCLHKHYRIEDLINYFKSLQHQDLDYIWYSLGIKSDDYLKLKRFQADTQIQPNICIDVANGYTDDFVNFCRTIRNDFRHSIIMAGNVATKEMCQELILHGGVDIVKVGIGPGAACTTRLKTGVGYPQLSAIDLCSGAAHGLKSDEKQLGLICGDGGIRGAGDFAKGFAANADFLMAGSIFAGTEQCEGEWQYDENDKKVSLLFYGMSSKKAQEKHGEGLKDYRSSEGRILSVPYKGCVRPILYDIMGGIRSACAYIGATCIKDMPKCAEFIKVNRVHHDRSIEQL